MQKEILHDKDQYQGKDVLDLMDTAKNYNTFLSNWIKKDLSRGKRILDFGAGIGQFCNQFSGYNIHAVELDTHLHEKIQCPVKKNAGRI